MIPLTPINHEYSRHDRIGLTARTAYKMLAIEEQQAYINRTIERLKVEISDAEEKLLTFKRWQDCADHKFVRKSAGYYLVDECSECGLHVEVPNGN